MKTKHKEFYEAPSARVLEMNQEGLICASDVKGGNSINDWGNGGIIDDEIYM